MVPLCASGKGAQKTYMAITRTDELGSQIGMTAEGAEEECANYSADSSFSLASIASAEENERARQACGDNSCWLGLRSGHPLHWKDPSVWSDGTSFGYANWWPVNQPPSQEEPGSPQLYVLMNIPGAEPGEHCAAIKVYMYLQVLALLCTGGLAAIAFMGADSLDAKRLNIVWQGWIGVWLVTLIQSAVETAQYAELNFLVPATWVWGFWAFEQFLVSAPLNAWWIISVRSLALRCDEGATPSTAIEIVDDTPPEPATVAASVKVFNPLRDEERARENLAWRNSIGGSDGDSPREPSATPAAATDEDTE